MTCVKVLCAGPIYAFGIAQVVQSLTGYRLLESDDSRPADGSATVVIMGGEGVAPDPSVVALQARTGAVLVLGPARDASEVRPYRCAGARGYVHASASLSTLVEAVRHLAAGRLYVALAAMDEPPTLDAGDTLSQRERQVLVHISHGRTHSQTAYALGISRHTVDTYVKRVKKKLGVHTKAGLTRAAILTNVH